MLVSFSGGKDSWICLDLAKRVANRVAAFTMELVPGLEIMESKLMAAEARYKLRIRRYPHWLRAKFQHFGVYCFAAPTVQMLDINDIYAVARADAGIRYIVTGAKKGDSLWRRRTGVLKFAGPDLKAPIWDWSTRDVLAYLKMNGIERPDGDGRNASGVDLSIESITYLHDHYHADYKKIEARFPFVGAIIKRRELYGVGAMASGIADARRASAETQAGSVQVGDD